VFEFGDSVPNPNRRRVYISYLDSVQFLSPRAFRTLVYQAILVEYMRFVKMRGFHTAHIWSCPPHKGDDYVFHIHPTDQKTPTPDRLAAWYNAVLGKAAKEGVVIGVNNLYNE
jgi:E1A/CREB-binding protein